MIVAEVLAKASPRKVIHILDKDNTTYYFLKTFPKLRTLIKN